MSRASFKELRQILPKGKAEAVRATVMALRMNRPLALVIREEEGGATEAKRAPFLSEHETQSLLT